MLLPSIKNGVFRARPAYRSDFRFDSTSSPLIGTNGIAATGNLRVIIPKGRNKVIVADASLVALVAASAATYTITVGKRTAAGVDVPLTTAQSVLAAGITALGGVGKTNTLPQVTTLTDEQRTVMPDDILYVDLAITTLTVQPTMQVSVDLFVQE
jgi:hypothetical protein